MSYQFFVSSIGNLLSLYLVLFLGFLAARYAGVEKTSIARLLIFIISPFVVFHGALRSQLAPSIFVIPVFFFLVPSTLAAVSYWIGGRIWTDKRRNLFAFSAASGNTGYFGIPVMLVLFGEKSLQFVVLAVTGIIFYEVVVAYYIAARGQFNARESLVKVLKLPLFYAFLLGMAARSLGMPESPLYLQMMDRFMATYSVLGMLLVGLGLAGASRADIDFSFVALTFVGRYMLWPLVTFAFVFLDRSIFHTLDTQMSTELLVFSFVPLAANSVAFAAQFDLRPEMASVAVALSTLVSLFLMPFVTTLVVG